MMTFRLYSIPVRCGDTRSLRQLWGDFLPFWSGMADYEGYERNSFARDVLSPMVIHQQNLNQIENIVFPHTCRFGSLRHALLITTFSFNTYYENPDFGTLLGQQ